MAPRHVRLWNWFDALTPGVRPPSIVEPWPRGGGKSSTAELGCARVAAKGSRRFVLYIGSQQDRADEHVQNVGGLLERLGLGRALNEYGQSKGWRHSQLRTASGFNLIALGLDVAVRGIKLEFYRPDLVIFDDFDSLEDTERAREKKIRTITRSILPAGSPDLAVAVLQNVITRDSIMSQLVDGRADFLQNRRVAEPEPAARDLAIEQVPTADGARFVVTGGEPTWAGQDLATIEQQINDWGLSAFLAEAQHEVDEAEHGMWDRKRDIEQWRVTTAPPLVAITVGVDPSATRGGDEAGIIAAGIDARRHAYVLEDASLRGAPGEWAARAVALYQRQRANRLVAEKNNGGEMVAVTFSTIPDAPKVVLVTASRGKATRAQPVQKLAQEGRIHHVGWHPQLERELCVAGGTLISTASGERSIERIRVGDSVLTRGGYRRVTWAGQTGTARTVRIALANGMVLNATAGHPIHTEARGFIPVAEVMKGDEVTVCQRQSAGRTSSSTGSATSSAITATMRRAIHGAVGCFTATFGKLRMGLSQKAGTSITSIMTNQTTTSRTLQPSPPVSMFSVTSLAALLHGRMDSTATRPNDSGSIKNPATSSVSSAVQPSSQLAREQCSALNGVMTSTVFSVNVLPEKVPVYNLSVDEEHEFFANGILTHNCTWKEGMPSPNRLDAFVWSITDLLLPETRPFAGVAGGGSRDPLQGRRL